MEFSTTSTPNCTISPDLSSLGSLSSDPLLRRTLFTKVPLLLFVSCKKNYRKKKTALDMLLHWPVRQKSKNNKNNFGNSPFKMLEDRIQYAKKVMSDSLGLVDNAIGLVNPVLSLPKGQVKIFGQFKLQKNCNQWCSSKIFWGLLKRLLG